MHSYVKLPYLVKQTFRVASMHPQSRGRQPFKTDTAATFRRMSNCLKYISNVTNPSVSVQAVYKYITRLFSLSDLVAIDNSDSIVKRFIDSR